MNTTIAVKVLWIVLAAVIGQFTYPIPERWIKGTNRKKAVGAVLVALFFAAFAADTEFDYQFGQGEFKAEETTCQQVAE